MSTFTAPAPAQTLRGPIPERPPHSLLALLEKLEADTATGYFRQGDRAESHFEAGGNIWMYPCVLASPHDPCSEGTFRDKSEGDGAGGIVAAMAFTAYAAMECSTISMGNWDDFEDRLVRAFRAVESHAVEEELATGGAISGNAGMGDANMDVLAGGAAVSPGVGLAYLEEAIAASGRRGFIHATPAVVTSWQAFPLGDAADTDRAILQTANGNYVASETGIVGVTPTGEAAPGTGESWAFATGAVAVRRGDEVRFDMVSQIDRATNDVVVRVERDYLVTFDPCVQAGVLIDWTA